MFWVKKVLSQLMMPIPFASLLILIGLLFIIVAYYQRNIRTTTSHDSHQPKASQHRTLGLGHIGKLSVFCGLLVIVLLSQTQVSNALLTPLEQQYPPNTAPINGQCWVMVLGSGSREQPNQSATQNLSATALARLTEGLKQMQLGQHCHLIVSGWNSGSLVHSHAQMMKQAAIELGVAAQNISSFDLPKDTIEEAHYAYQLVGEKPFRLVTSASHMPRAMMIFKGVGLSPQAAPGNYTSNVGRWWQLGASNLLNSQKSIHEYVGQLWLKIKGLSAISNKKHHAKVSHMITKLNTATFMDS
ncbi:YdcF family protein [Shewanella intestini]|uniref:YdcF family protein n=1 Tax=Shewanella intestini TaxID=2017544 RepID=A0ABS5HYH6_9GAMM|nr:MULTISPECIES: ElyC/SanA/YdcF family protein [Shewanella]MBR9726842.1 YdcF family protein [Shewanella intestini]MRG34592.1 YdcF family protein [Shewanella sp. XMDDZSB0408]